jgi:hypothetical protein
MQNQDSALVLGIAHTIQLRERNVVAAQDLAQHPGTTNSLAYHDTIPYRDSVPAMVAAKSS